MEWARLDYISEAYPCKQSVSLVVAMFGTMGLAAILGVVCFLFGSFLPLTVSLGICAVLLAALCWFFRKLLITWGVEVWDAL